jgi:hypothetical protein
LVLKNPECRLIARLERHRLRAARQIVLLGDRPAVHPVDDDVLIALGVAPVQNGVNDSAVGYKIGFQLLVLSVSKRREKFREFLVDVEIEFNHAMCPFAQKETVNLPPLLGTEDAAGLNRSAKD